MSVLIEKFKKEHSNIIEALKEVEELGIHTKEGHAKLMSLIIVLLKHLWNEDKQLYPVLKKASEHNKKLKEILSLFVNGLGATYVEMLNFMAKYYKGVVRDINFQRDYERLFGALSKRIEYEENILYDEYNMLHH
jgi:hypothetical protein